MKSWTSIVVLVSISFMALFSYFLYREMSARIDKTGGESIGTITFKKRSASRRYMENVIWEEIEQESDIYNYDAIRTFEYSSAVIALKDGTKIELDQNTLLVVILSDKGLNINFDQGGISAQSGSGTVKPITLNSKDATIALDKGGISVNSGESGMNIKVSSGKATIASEGKELQISPDEITTLKNGVVDSKKNLIVPEYPVHNSYLISLTKMRNVKLSWRSGIRGDFKVEISRGSDFKNIFRSYKSSKTNLEVSLPQGDYYWRIGAGSAVSNPVKFTILADRKPELIAPHNNQKITVTGEMGMVTFRWEKSGYASSYELTAARDRKMSDVVLNLNSKINIISTPLLKPGVYYWTVRSVYSSGIIADSTLSGPDVFALEKLQFSNVKPVPLDQGPITTAAPFTLYWKGVPGSESYNVEISSDTGFKNIILTKNTVNTFLKVEKKLSEGKYFWRVSAQSGEKNSSTSSAAVITLIKPVDLILLYPKENAVLMERTSVIKFSWRDPNNGDRYLVELSGRSDFRNITHSIECNVPEAELKNPGEGNYFWRVKLQDISGNIVARSSTGEFIIPGNLTVPVLITPGNNQKIIPGLKNRFRFEWGRVAGANEYEIEIFQRIAGIDKPLIISSSGNNYIELSNLSLFIPGDYSWIVRAKQIKNGRVAAYKESEKSYFEVVEVKLLPAPVVKNPGIIFK